MDALITREELETYLNTEIPPATADLLIELATGVVQGVTGQRIVAATSTEVVDATYPARTLELTQYPIREVSNVVLEGQTIEDYKLVRQRLWRKAGWAAQLSEPSRIEVTYLHGYDPDDRHLATARKVVLTLCAAGVGNPEQVRSESIDDYRVTYSEALSRMDVPELVRDELIRVYGRTAYVT